MKVEKVYGSVGEENYFYVCPRCNEPVEVNEKRCYYCGQLLDWEDNKNE